MAHFDPPAIQDNPNGWGPCSVPDKFKDMPYQPFSKGDRLGKVIFALYHMWGSGWGVWNSLISKNLTHYSLSLKFLLIF